MFIISHHLYINKINHHQQQHHHPPYCFLIQIFYQTWLFLIICQCRDLILLCFIFEIKTIAIMKKKKQIIITIIVTDIVFYLQNENLFLLHLVDINSQCISSKSDVSLKFSRKIPSIYWVLWWNFKLYLQMTFSICFQY